MPQGEPEEFQVTKGLVKGCKVWLEVLIAEHNLITCEAEVERVKKNI
jgi:hypothetical protein